MAKITVSSGISYEIKGDILTVEIDLSANPNAITKSGKNHMVATTGWERDFRFFCCESP